VSLLFYGAVLTLLGLYFFDQERFRTIQIQEQAIDVVVMESAPKPTPTPPKSSKKSPSTKRPGSSTPKHRPSIQELFAGVKVEKRKKIPRSKSRPSRLKGANEARAKELVSKLDIKEYTPPSKRSIKSISGEKDPYLQKVYKILYSYWAPSLQSAGNSAIVKIFIDRYGNFSYTILRPSASALFNEELQSYLESLRQVPFPAPKEDRSITVRFEAKD